MYDHFDCYNTIVLEFMTIMAVITQQLEFMTILTVITQQC